MSLASEPTLARVSRAGRYRGAVTGRPLPEHDAEIAALPRSLRATLASIWLSQAATEARVARSFGIIHRSLAQLDADPGLVALAARAVDDEHRHAALCEELAGRYAGRVVGPHASLPHQRPVHREATSPELRAALFVVGQCALNETFASAYLDAARREAKTPLARAALRALLEDEVDHARIGWAYLSTLTPALRAALSDWLVPLVVCNLREWRRLELPDGDALAAHGVPPKEVAVEALDAAARDLLVPAFRHVGLDTRALERWVTSGLPT